MCFTSSPSTSKAFLIPYTCSLVSSSPGHAIPGFIFRYKPPLHVQVATDYQEAGLMMHDPTPNCCPSPQTYTIVAVPEQGGAVPRIPISDCTVHGWFLTEEAVSSSAFGDVVLTSGEEPVLPSATSHPQSPHPSASSIDPYLSVHVPLLGAQDDQPRSLAVFYNWLVYVWATKASFFPASDLHHRHWREASCEALNPLMLQSMTSSRTGITPLSGTLILAQGLVGADFGMTIIYSTQPLCCSILVPSLLVFDILAHYFRNLFWILCFVLLP